MYDSTARFMANKLKEYCIEQECCSKCAFGYYSTLIGVNGEQVSKNLSCGLNYPEDDWTIPEEGRT